ncbi:MAG TPA: zinc-ribbon domain-containing protein, partial [Thermoanaerobaculia bacterium]|nr:zinc-ribbon domain-containing protein [Thermoanaerobaculia bacterium]
MIIQCPKCQARYQYDPSRFEGRESKKIRCAKCQDVFEIKNPEGASQQAPAEAPVAASHAPLQGAELNDMTLARHRRAYSYSGTPIDSPRVADLEAAAAAPAPPVAEPLALPSDRRFSVAITDGANAATIFRIEKPRMTIGRSG